MILLHWKVLYWNTQRTTHLSTTQNSQKITKQAECLSLAFYNAPNLHTVDYRLEKLGCAKFPSKSSDKEWPRCHKMYWTNTVKRVKTTQQNRSSLAESLQKVLCFLSAVIFEILTMMCPFWEGVVRQSYMLVNTLVVHVLPDLSWQVAHTEWSTGETCRPCPLKDVLSF